MAAAGSAGGGACDGSPGSVTYAAERIEQLYHILAAQRKDTSFTVQYQFATYVCGYDGGIASWKREWLSVCESQWGLDNGVKVDSDVTVQQFKSMLKAALCCLLAEPECATCRCPQLGADRQRTRRDPQARGEGG